MNDPNNFDPEFVFTYHSPTEENTFCLMKVRELAKELSQVILDYVPACADRTAALRKLRECVMTANAAIVLEGRMS